MRMPDDVAARARPGRRIVERARGDAETELATALSARMARIYGARGITSIDDLDCSMTRLLQPSLLGGSAQAAALLADAIAHGQHVCFVGDFDADGATSSALGVAALRAMGCSNVGFVVPNRFEYGYGLTPEIVELAMRDAPDVLVTVDNGIASIEGVAAARAAGARVIVTDHHLPGRELPAADAIVNPNLPDSTFGSRNLAGVGVIFYVLSQLRSLLRSRGWFAARGIEEPNMADYLDLVAVGTVADVVPLDRNNRILVQQGLRRMRAGRTRHGLRALCEAAGRSLPNLTAQDLAFAIGPRINAAGRLDDISIGIRCLLTDDPIQARSLATALEELNQTRRGIEQQMTREAELAVAGLPLDATASLGLCVYRESWHQGIVGIVAGRLKDRFQRPVIAFADAGPNAPDELKGSARSVQGVQVRDALDAGARRYPGLIQRFGGHAMAAGLSIRRVHLARFTDAFAKEVARWISVEQVAGIIESDGELPSDELELALADEIAAGGPWGQSFPEPLFHGDFDVVTQRVVGSGHLKLVLRKDARVVDAIAFNQGPLTDAGRVRIAYRLARNDYRDNATLQLVVEYIEATQSC
jgi:single-stranded-DNA-specific exonuclease